MDDAQKAANPIDLLGRYQSHKKIMAGKILALDGDGIRTDTIIVEGAYGERIEVPIPGNFFARGRPEVGDYFVAYADGYVSHSPAKVFELGNRRLPDHDAAATDIGKAADSKALGQSHAAQAAPNSDKVAGDA